MKQEKGQTKSKVSKRKEIIHTKAEITETENRKGIENTNQTKSWSFDINRSISLSQAD